ncbi:MAG: hypothetical protein RLY95_1566 [Pseudomonadota bacterium]|jgi:integrase
MASITKYEKGWRAQVYVKGQRESKTFEKKSDATMWAERTRIELLDQANGKTGEKKTLLDAMRKFGKDVSPSHKGERWEQIRLEALCKDERLPLRIPLARATAQHFNVWRDSRLSDGVKPSTVSRELGLLSSVMTTARRDWGWISKAPMADVRKPKATKHRERVIAWSETKKMLRGLGHVVGQPPESAMQVTAYAFCLALRTGMRESELTGLAWDRHYGAWVLLGDTKNGDSRQVPLSKKAQRIFSILHGLESPLPITSATLDQTFRRARVAQGLLSGEGGFTFHDSRHTAATRIGRTVGQFGKLSFPEFCKVFGWRDPKHALIYVNPTGAELASKL